MKLRIARFVGWIGSTMGVVAWPGATAALGQPADAEANIRAALPEKAYATPDKPRRLLVYTATTGFRHESIPTGVMAVKLMGEKTGAYEAVHSEDMTVFEKVSLATFDGVLLLNTTGELFAPAGADRLAAEEQAAAAERMRRLQANLRAFVESGGGLAGIHSATDTSYQWEWYGRTIGGYFDGHPWNADTDVVIRIDDPTHPLTAMFEGKPLEFKEEIYQMKDPYSRRNQRVLLSLDTVRTNMKRDGVKRTDGDFGVSWVRTAGKGRVFYCSLGHNHHIYWNPKVLRHYLAGLQYVLGDLKVESAPVPSRSADGSPPGE